MVFRGNFTDYFSRIKKDLREKAFKLLFPEKDIFIEDTVADLCTLRWDMYLIERICKKHSRYKYCKEILDLIKKENKDVI